jgi:hypothetical protein
MPRGDGTGPRGQGPGTDRGTWGEVPSVAAYEVALQQAQGAIVYVRAAVSQLPTNPKPLAFSEMAQVRGHYDTRVGFMVICIAS